MTVINGLQSDLRPDRLTSRPYELIEDVPTVFDHRHNELDTAFIGADDVDDFDIRHLRYFLAVVRAGSISAAAQELRISQPSLSQQIRRLERRVGTALFSRNPRGVELTGGGRAFLHEVQPIPGLLRAAIAAAVPPPAVWDVGVCAGVPAQALSRVQDALTQPVDGESASPSLHMRAVPTARQATLMQTGALAFGILRLPVREVQLSHVTVWDEPLGVVMSAGHPLAGLTRPQWSHLATQRLLWYHAGCAPGYAESIPAQLAALGWSPQLHPVDSEQESLFVHALQSSNDLVALQSAAFVADHAQLVWRPLPTNRPPREQLALTALVGSPQARVLLHHALRLGWPPHH